ncbi:MAG TPA: hypothetical protein VEG39_07085 [Clostridia bacterium]|nr:hypothetical protein [Clostridia bacterium]
MFKKVLITAAIATAVFAAGSAVYAQSDASYVKYGKDTAPVFDLQSDKDESKTFEKEYIISGNAEEGTEVTFDLYWFGTEDDKSIIVKKKPSEDSEEEGIWILQQSEEFTVGASGIFAESVDLNLGKNKIVLFITDKNGNTDERTLEVERFLEKEASEEVNGNNLNKVKEDLSNKVNTNE